MPQNGEIAYSLSNDLVMTPTPCRVAGCIISVTRIRIGTRALTYLLTYLLTQLARTYKAGNISEMVERQLGPIQLTAKCGKFGEL